MHRREFLVTALHRTRNRVRARPRPTPSPRLPTGFLLKSVNSFKYTEKYWGTEPPPGLGTFTEPLPLRLLKQRPRCGRRDPHPPRVSLSSCHRPALRRARVSCVCVHILPWVSHPHSRGYHLSAQPHPAVTPTSTQEAPRGPQNHHPDCCHQTELCLGAGLSQTRRVCASGLRFIQGPETSPARPDAA